MTKTHKTYLDVLRIIAIWFVIFNHTRDYGYTYFATAVNQVGYWPGLLISVVTKIAVPVFWMISGGLLLDKEEDMKTLFFKRILRFAIVLIVFSMFQYIWWARNLSMPLSVYQFSGQLYGVGLTAAYWYLYAYIAYLLMLPMLRKLVKVMSDQMFLYMFALYLIFGSLAPLLEFWVFKGEYTLNHDFMLTPILCGNIIYPFLGYYIEKRRKLTYRRIIPILMAISAAMIALAAYTETYDSLYHNDWSTTNADKFFNAAIFIPAITIYLIAKAIGDRHQNVPAWLAKLLQIIGTSTFGVMLIENRVSDYYEMHYLSGWISKYGHLAGAFHWVTVTTLTAMLIIVVLRLIPGVKKFI